MSRASVIVLFVILIPAAPGRGRQLRASPPFKLFFEKIYLHTDRSIYTANDDIWFKAYLVDGKTNKLTATSNNLYVELIAPADTLAQRKLIRLDEGLGNGDFHLNDPIVPGSYRLRAYTNWMRNFGDKFIFEKQLTVYAAAPKVPEGKIKENKRTAAAPTPTIAANPEKERNELNFFPEGGSLIEGVSAMVAFKSEGRVAVKGSIQTSSGDPVTDFESDAAGFGSFILLPEKGISYQATGTYGDGQTFKVILPAARSSGISMHVTQNDSLVKIILGSNRATSDHQQSRKLMITGKSHDLLSFTARAELNSAQAMINIPRSQFNTGINTLTVYEDGVPQAERLLFIDRPAAERTLVITAGKAIPLTGGSVAVSLDLVDRSGKPVNAALSLAAVNAEVIPDETIDIVSYLDLLSEVKGAIARPGWYFDENNPSRKHDLDLLLMTQGWRDFVWKKLADSAIAISYAPEQGITVSGRVREKFSNKPVAGANISLNAFRARGDRLFSAISDSAGKFHFDDVKLYDEQPLVLASLKKMERKGYIELNPISATNWPPLASLREDDTTGISTGKAFFDRVEQVSKKSILLKEVELKTVKTIPVWGMTLRIPNGYKQEVLNVTEQDKKEFKNLRQYLIARLQNLIIFSEDGMKVVCDPMLSVNLSVPQRSYMKSVSGPRLFVNGKEQPFTDLDPPEIVASYLENYYSMPVSAFKKIEFKRTYGFDDMENESRDVYLLYLTVEPTAIVSDIEGSKDVTVNGYATARKFYEPRGKDADIAGLNATLAWVPYLQTDEQGKTVVKLPNVPPGTPARIVVQGISENGTPLAATAVVEIK